MFSDRCVCGCCYVGMKSKPVMRRRLRIITHCNKESKLGGAVVGCNNIHLSITTVQEGLDTLKPSRTSDTSYYTQGTHTSTSSPAKTLEVKHQVLSMATNPLDTATLECERGSEKGCSIAKRWQRLFGFIASESSILFVSREVDKYRHQSHRQSYRHFARFVIIANKNSREKKKGEDKAVAEVQALGACGRRNE